MLRWWSLCAREGSLSFLCVCMVGSTPGVVVRVPSLPVPFVQTWNCRCGEARPKDACSRPGWVVTALLAPATPL